MDLLPPNGTREGEMQVTDPQVRGTRIIFTTMIPSDSPCDFGGDGWLMELNARDGAQLDERVFDLERRRCHSRGGPRGDHRPW